MEPQPRGQLHRVDGEREREREGPPRPLEGGDEQGPSKKPRLLTWEEVAKKIEDGVCAGAEDMKIDGVFVNGLEVNQGRGVRGGRVGI